ncbi:Chaperone protein DnaJ 2 [Trichinella spiralis]|uniref:Chaperone protein DnaJ 2 n=1 Tax=Trichinella spiralis TaxID=6334 RepID=A0A0V1BZG2_TRISP|nr:Chaperone protein DnaJ 2 [Trichinella spiralis]
MVVNVIEENKVHFNVLNATFEELKAAYQCLLFQFHPDKCEKNYCYEKYSRVLQAWNILRNDTSRRRYNCWLRENQLRDDSVCLFAQISISDFTNEWRSNSLLVSMPTVKDGMRGLAVFISDIRNSYTAAAIE